MERSDLSAYVITIVVVLLMLLGKYLMFKGDEPAKQALKEGTDKAEENKHNTKEIIEDKKDA